MPGAVTTQIGNLKNTPNPYKSYLAKPFAEKTTISKLRRRKYWELLISLFDKTSNDLHRVILLAEFYMLQKNGIIMPTETMIIGTESVFVGLNRHIDESIKQMEI